MNKHILLGTLGKDAEVKEFSNGNNVINFSVAYSDSWKDKQGEKQEKTTWYECEWFINNLTITNYLKKGARVLIEGQPYSRAYVNQQGGAIPINVVRIRSLEIVKFVEVEKKEVSNNAPEKATPYYTERKAEDDDLPF